MNSAIVRLVTGILLAYASTHGCRLRARAGVRSSKAVQEEMRCKLVRILVCALIALTLLGEYAVSADGLITTRSSFGPEENRSLDLLCSQGGDASNAIGPDDWHRASAGHGSEKTIDL